MGRPKQVSDAEILAAARTAFLRDGPSATTSTIAESLGVSPPALFKRFGSKEALMLAALAPPQLPDWVQAVQAGPDARPLREQLLEIATRGARFLENLVPCVAVLRASGVDREALFAQYEQGPPPMLALRAITGWFERARDRGLVPPETDAFTTSHLFLGAIHLRAFFGHVMMGREHDLPNISDPRFLESIVDMLTRALEPR